MAASFIPVDNGAALGRALLKAASDARAFAEEIAGLKRIMDAMTNATDYSIVETQFGIPAGRGGDVVYLISNLKTGLDALSQFGLLPDWFGQV